MFSSNDVISGLVANVNEVNFSDFEKCETSVKSKFTKKPFPSVKRTTSLLELIHSDICELNGILTRGGKSKAYRLLDIESGVVVESKDVKFFEDKFSKDEENSSHTTPTSTSREIPPPPPIVEETRRSTRAGIKKIFGDDFDSYLVEGTQKKVTREVIFSINLDDDHKTLTESMTSRDTPLWKEAINDEMDSIMGILETKKYLSSKFKMKDIGEVDTILGIKVKTTCGQISLSQSHYIEKVLKKFQHLNIKEFITPFDSSVKLNVNSGRAVAQLEYVSAVGSMVYVTHCTRPDIAFIVRKLSQYIVNPGMEHWKAVGRVL
ncbi:uncharacterized protein LOC128128996 [Lactuca sativa]|uniref:uncharacterized protein LOC128128996 n=1 Tax=Lactuca sativa TaxID=4236 RepID=UPI0022AF4AC3|nr:uncharacterized protein LOC128128996 [Lactuca sativa]